MNNEQIYDAIHKWMNSIPFLKSHASFSSYSDGTIFIQILYHINADFFGSTYQVLMNQVSIDDWRINVSRLKLILEKLNEYSHMHHNINVMSIAKDDNKEETLKIFDIIFQIILKSQFQDEFFSPVLLIDEQYQEMISTHLSQLVEPLQQQDDQVLLEKIDELENENTKLICQINKINKEREELAQMVKSLETENNHKYEQIKTLESQQSTSFISELHLQELEEANKQLWGLQAQVKDYEDKINKLNNQNQYLQLQNERMDFENQQFKAKILQLTKAEEKIETLKDKLNSQKQSFQNNLDEKDKQLQKIQEQYAEIYNLLQLEKKKCLTFETDVHKLSQQIHEINYEYLEKEQTYIDKIKEVSRRNSMEIPDQRASSQQMGDFNPLSQELRQLEFLHIQQSSLAMAEENYKREIELLTEKNKSLEQQIVAWKQMNGRAEEKIKNLEVRMQQVNDQFSTQQLQKQNDQILYLTQMINSFNKKFSKLKEEAKQQ